MADSGPETRRVLRCPRCGYDLTGTPPTWQDACPIAGLCSECGVTFEWGDLFNPRRNQRPWFIEDDEVRGWGRLLIAGIRTTLRAARPWRFWRDIRMEQPVNRWRLGWFAVWWLVTVYVLIIVLYVGYLASILLSAMVSIWDLGIARQIIHLLIWPWYYLIHPIYAALLVFHLAPCLLLCLLTDSLARARVRMSHLVRASAYALVLPGLIMLLSGLVILLVGLFYGLEWFATGRFLAKSLRSINLTLAITAVPLWWGFVIGRYMR
ncbi:MAG: hypothetical protein KDA21_13810, partial [Phycisphaerales bacterium]|nr:hypothetical protein [Phycisphaerales bacterium]